MLELPKIISDPKLTEDLCKCRPICKSRRRKWKGQLLKTSDELLLERKPLPSCFRRWPMKISPNGPCPLFARTKGLTLHDRNAPIPEHHVVRICPAPVDETADVTYLDYAAMAKRIGAWGAVKACCAFCECGACCPCGIRDYMLHDAERALRRRDDMRAFDARVKKGCEKMRIMYDKT